MLDKNTYKAMKYIDRYSGRASYNKFNSKFGNLKNPSLDSVKHWMFVNKYAYFDDYVGRDGYGEPFDPQTIVLSIEGKRALEELKSRKSRDIFARITSIIALAMAAGSLIVSIMALLKQ